MLRVCGDHSSVLFSNVIPVAAGRGVGIMRDVHFVRLLSVILESAITAANTSVVLTSRAHISKVFHPI